MQPRIPADPPGSNATDHVAARLARRLAAVQSTGLRENTPTEAFDRLTRIATTLLHVPIALVTLVDADQQVLVSSRGLAGASAGQAPLAHSLSQEVVATGEPLLIADVRAHPLVQDNPVLADFRASAYAGIPLVTPEGDALGCVSVIDHQPRAWTDQEVTLLRDLASTAMMALELCASRQWRALAEHATDLVVVLNADGTYRYVSPSFKRILGFTPEEMVGRPSLDHVHPADRPAVRAALARMVEGGEPFVTIAYRRRHAGGSWRVVESIAHNRLADSAVRGIIVNSRDITELVRAQDALRESQWLFQHAFEDASIGMAIVGLDGRFLQVNPAECRMLGYAEEELLGRSFLDLTHPDDVALSQEQLRRLLSGEVGSLLFEKRLVHRDGHTLWALISSSLVRDAQGRPLYLLAHVQDITERKQAEAALRASEERLRTVIANAPLILFTLDAQGVCTLCEGQGLARAGLASDALVGTSLAERYSAYPEVVEGLRRVLSGEGVMATFTSRAQGVVFDTCMAPLHDAQGRVGGAIGVATDVTARARAEEALRTSEERFRLLFESMSVGVVLLDHAATIVLANPAARALLGHRDASAHPLEGLSFFDSVSAAVREDGTPLTRAEGPPARALATGEPVRDVAFGVPRPDGGHTWLLASAYPLRDGAGAVTGALATFTDITQRKEAEEALRQSEQRVRTLIEAAPIGIFVLDELGRFETVNDAFCALTGYTRDELTGREAFDLAPPEQREEHWSTYRAQVARGERDHGEFEGVAKDGARGTGLSTSVQITGPDGRPRHLSFVIDITERKRAEEQVREANAELERASRLKSEFLATMSHEIRTPLNGVLGLADLLLATPLDAQQREYATALRSAGDTLLALVNDVLDLSKIEAGHLELESQPFDPRQLVGDVVETLLAPAEAKGLVVASRVEPEVPALLRGDPVRLRQVLTNLVANAVKFTERGDVTVWGRLVEWANGAATVEMAVSDTGIGIPPEALPHLFDAFTQADATTTRHYGGTGLGLAIAKRLVEAMGGQIRVDSAVGQGSTFWVTVRLPVEAVGAPARATSEVTPARAGPLATGRDDDAATIGQPGAAARRVLVAEDNPVNQLVARGLLEGLGYTVEVVADGQQAVAALGRGQYDLVLMDCQMPVLDGYAAAAAIRRQEGGRRTPIVAMTAHALAGEAEKCRAAGMDDYVAKPVTTERLAAMMARWAPAAGAGRPDAALDPSVIAALRELEQGQPGLLARMVGLYLRDARTQLAALRQAAERGDGYALEWAAHSLKGGSAQIGATAMVALCRDLETAAQAQDSSRVAALVAGLEQTFDQVRAALAALPEATGPGPTSETDA